ncbi:P-loop containing nucleoside triphosphate hydrolase protein [Rhizopus microsporus var. microsporus]|uniref:P-loop containing nucleoside triphosphate hydrolase protein n=1 Tax=Rhizopus microsporus var. microsporus TaxID=86635 RepID=A0A1X0RE54_RHIZD|nr:P-loop containing nucleoside triphosphate hydrolase protein [Rhizopus microsporus var. microsporus]
MLDYRCTLSQPWIGNDFSPCFRDIIINGALPIVLLTGSIIYLTIGSIKHYRPRKHGYEPLLKHSQLPTVHHYGSAAISDSASDDTITHDITIETSRWTLFNLSRFLLSLAQLALCVIAIQKIYHKTYEFTENEGSEHEILGAYMTQAAFWVYCFALSIVNIYLSRSYTALANTICNHLNLAYVINFLIGIVNVRSYYILKLNTEVAFGYKASICSTIISFVLIVLVINETRNAPTKAVVTESGRTLSPENWASLYSQFMFSWVNVMMKEGYRRTLNDNDLLELPAENRAKNALSEYQRHKQSKSLVATLMRTFHVPLLIQLSYCLTWSILLFGPPLFLNLIIKYIENPRGEPVTTAFFYVLGLFVTNSAQSLCLQQALYIGRIFSIRIQSIVIGEVFSKSLRRRDQSGSSSENDKEVVDKKEKSNVNNLLSVDAQKVAEIAAYIFYIYSYPIQIVISIWSLYKLLGVAALWGVLVMVACQPITYYISRRFEKLHEAVMSATDKRLKLVNELLSAIRIVKFFAWESEFKKRILNARENELGAIRSRLMMFMWILNAWFLIPVLIMVTVFYVYTETNTLTASVAFTALALFNTFRGALDEFPLMISLVLQGNVSVKRVEKFLDEDEVDPIKEEDANGTMIGFVDDATFSWDNKPTNPDGTFKAAIKNLNLSFPVGKLSIVCGPTGSGKTTLLASLLGETHRMAGRAVLPRIIPNKTSPLGGAVSGIAYVAQTAWLQNCSIRDNILFGLPYDEQRYQDVLYMTALTRDLDILEFGDATEVGEKGITLSGGQKQRVAIARAVYSQANTVILDDCLSAVDAHTAKHLYEHCLTGHLMKGRTVILVTHHVGLCLNGADYVVALKDGEVAAAGVPKDMLKSGALGEELANAEKEKADVSEERAVDGPIPTVPKTAVKKTTAEGDGKLVKEEERAEGGVSWSVYKTYIDASGGFMFWITVLVLFCAAQGTTLAQDYWIRVWSAAYGRQESEPMTNVTAVGTVSIAGHSVSAIGQGASFINFYMYPTDEQQALEAPANEPIDAVYYLGIYFLIGMGAMLLTSLRTFILFTGAINASRRIHKQLLDRILRAKVRFYDTTPLGRIVNRFSSDLATIDQEVGPQLSFFIYSIVATLCVIMLVSYVTPTFLVPGAFIAGLFWMIGTYYLETSRDLKRLNSVSRSPIYVQFNESVNGVATIRAFGSQHRFINENYAKVDSNNRPFIWMWATNRWLHCRVDILGAFVGFCTGFVLILARDWIDPGLAGLSLSYSLTFTHHVLWVVRNYAMNEMNMNAVERVHEYLDIEEEPPTEIPETEPRPSWPEHGSVEVKDLVMQYAPENPPVLRNVSFKVNPREKIGIVGRTGSGKSTLALSLFRFMEPTSGHVYIDGVDIHTIGLNTLRSRLTIIPQDPVLFSGTLRSNLDPFDQHDDAELWASLKRAHLIDDENQQGENAISLDSPVTENGSNWSQGQRQLIALARALVKKSSLIILDEATSSVDFDTDHKIQETIRTEFKNSALLCIAHRIRTVADYDRILVLDHGQVKEFDTPYHLMKKEGGIFQQMCVRSGEYNELLSIAKKKHESH